MSKKLERVLGTNFKQVLVHKQEELEQEVQILEWKNPTMPKEAVYQRAVLNILYSEYKFYKYHHLLQPISVELEDTKVESLIQKPIGVYMLSAEHTLLTKLTAYERYIVYLLTSNTKREVSSLLNCSPSYLSKLLDGVKIKLLKN